MMQKWTTNSGAKDGSPAVSPDVCLSMLIEGATLGVPEVDVEAYRRFRGNVERLIHQLASQLPTEDKIALIQAVVLEFDTYRADTENAIRDQLIGWRGLVSKLFGKLLTLLGIETNNPDAFSLNQSIRHLSTAAEIQSWDDRLTLYLDPKKGPAPTEDLRAQLRIADTSTANDNAAGLPGGGLALERLSQLIKQNDRGHVVLFRLGCLELVNERFGDEAVQDSIMAIAAYLTHSLHREDTIYHWTDSSLLAVVQKRTNEVILQAELRRIASMNRDININIGGRLVMLRIPIEFEIVPIVQLHTADDIRKLMLESNFTH